MDIFCIKDMNSLLLFLIYEGGVGLYMNAIRQTIAASFCVLAFFLIDFKHEEIVQKAIDQLLKNSTLISIAHRIKTVLNSDKILVLENGEVKEFDKPDVLLKQKNSYFSELYTKSLI